MRELSRTHEWPVRLSLIVILSRYDVLGTIDVNLNELQYLAARLNPFECRRLIAALHYTTYELPSNLADAERNVDDDIPCVRHLVHWNSSPAEGKGKTHEVLAHRLRQINRNDLADWLGKSAAVMKPFDELSKEETELPQNHIEIFFFLSPHPVTLEPSKREKDPWTQVDVILMATLLGLLGTLLTLICYTVLQRIRQHFRTVKYKKLKQQESEDEREKTRERMIKNSVQMLEICTGSSRVEAANVCTVKVCHKSKLNENKASMTDIGIEVECAVKEEKSKIYLQLISSIIINLTFLASGICISWPAVTLSKLKPGSDLVVSDDNGGWIVCALGIGGIVGPILAGLLLDRIGRKWFIYATSVPFIACWVLTYLAKSWVELLVARLVAGISIGASSSIVPVYVGEIAEPRIRGACSAMTSLMINLGYIFTYGLGPFLNRKMFALVCLTPTAVFLLTALWLPESPYHYLKKNKDKSAALTLVWLRRKKNNDNEIKQMKESIKNEKEGGFKKLFTVPPHRKAFWILFLVITGQTLCGFIIIISYLDTLVKHFHINFVSDIILLLISVVSLISGILSSCFVDKFGRRFVFLISSYGTTLCFSVIGAYFLLGQLKVKTGDLSLVPLIALVLYIIIVSFGLLPMPAIITSEIFPTNIKGWAIMIANIYGSVCNIIAPKLYQIGVTYFGYHVVFLALAVIQLIIAIIASIYLPETSRKTFEQIQKDLQPKNKAKKKKDEN
ncbi:Facilitated trehalose transporter Tret1 [Melipona quadrifasciata]|uniref:Facilitated trehalose transporter Tret1 n=1 Tax=Melipona quadrifasciata TaxID=166423 RepID=A0A0M9A594_9HYME|nr:Facilitated trehalose transporter Tret1 [Melipona quadrifasciata]